MCVCGGGRGDMQLGRGEGVPRGTASREGRVAQMEQVAAAQLGHNRRGDLHRWDTKEGGMCSMCCAG
jgi:hypothetical protein